MELLETHSRLELQDEWAYYKCNPYGEWRDDLRVAIQSSLIANINSKQKFTHEDFMPSFTPKKKNVRKLLEAQLGHLISRV